MGLRRYERVQNSSRPAAKLGGGGGWNTEQSEKKATAGAVGGGAVTSAPLPPFPGTHPSAVWGQQQDPAAKGASASASASAAVTAATISAARPKMKAFSGRGWRRAAPGFGNPEDAVADGDGDGDPSPKEPKILIGNLATDVPPEEIRGMLETLVDGLDLDVPGDLAAVHVAVFGPARWGEEGVEEGTWVD